ncbi:MAG: hypothetical protein Q9196_006172 [Gyalolechia fulgens]
MSSSSALTDELAICLHASYFRNSLALLLFDIILDVGTDLLIIGIPLRLLWSVKIKPGQKFILGLFLSLNIFMAIVAAIRVSGLKSRGTFDFVWLFLWQQIEACVAVAMISLTAFRSVFVASEASRARRQAVQKPWHSSVVEAVRRKKGWPYKKERADLEMPTLPSATLTGMRTFIQGGGRPTRTKHQNHSSASFDGEPDDWPLRHGHST